ncbi:MAG: PHP domain-containing protein [Caldilineaceae bacterium]|nr:PHP domain-containing protein [Caldilineaceae bacterium]
MQNQFSDTLTAAQVKHHIPHRFVVPENCQRLHIRLHFEPLLVGKIRNMLTLTLFDAEGFRGAGHRQGDVHEVTLTPSTATPGYYPGPLPAGEWMAQIDTHMIMPGADVPYKLTVTAELGEAVAATKPAQPARFDFVANPNPGWYRGDIHAHTLHSDASWGVAELVDAARAIGLDFVTLTDHNTTSPLPEMASYSAPDLLTMGGMELTTFWGHAVCLGAMEWIDWRVDPAGEGMARIAEAQTATGALFIIAHPNDQGDPKCTGCRWVYPQMRPGPARLVEIWNGRWESTDPDSKNEGSLNLWYSWLNDGHRLAATAGTDAHGPAPLDGVGFNTVFAHELSQRAILEGLAAGRNYLSAGPSLSFSAQNEDNEIALIGEHLPTGGEITLQCAWTDAPDGASLRLVRNGAVIDEHIAKSNGSAEWTFPSEQGQWYVLELRRRDGWMAAVTNPIFVE